MHALLRHAASLWSLAVGMLCTSTLCAFQQGNAPGTYRNPINDHDHAYSYVACRHIHTTKSCPCTLTVNLNSCIIIPPASCPLISIMYVYNNDSVLFWGSLSKPFVDVVKYTLNINVHVQYENICTILCNEYYIMLTPQPLQWRISHIPSTHSLVGKA